MAKLQNVQFSAGEASNKKYVVKFGKSDTMAAQHYGSRDSRIIGKKEQKPKKMEFESVRKFIKKELQEEAGRKVLICIDASDEEISESGADKLAQKIKTSECIVGVRITFMSIGISSFEALVETRKLESISISEYVYP